jgi:hypothetical protein
VGRKKSCSVLKAQILGRTRGQQADPSWLRLADEVKRLEWA